MGNKRNVQATVKIMDIYLAIRSCYIDRKMGRSDLRKRACVAAGIFAEMNNNQIVLLEAGNTNLP